ncbi:22727_t:CDS:2, partial [Entrophospora sp. SA101]
LFIEADIREIPELGELVASKIIDQVSDDNWSEILFIGWKTKNYSLKNAALSYIRINWEKIKRGRKINEVIAHGDMELIDELMYTICFEYDSLSSSSSSIIDEDIDFDLVYSMHTFEATVEGQASVEKGDSLTLLDDSNIYWWLVKLTKNGKTGYIPAEIIE